MKFTKGTSVLAHEKKTGTLYMTLSPRETITVAKANTDTSLWHCKLGHISEKMDEYAAVKRETTRIEVH